MLRHFFSLICLLAVATTACAEVDTPPVSTPSDVATNPDPGTESVLFYALSLNGTQYKFGGRDSQEGFDCSGFVSHVFRQVSGIVLPHNALAISQVGQKITPSELKPGDLVFFNTLRRAFSHVGIYLGDNRFIHASSSLTGNVMISDMTERYWSKRFNGARRLASAE